MLWGFSTVSLTYVLQTDEATMKVAEISGENIDPGTKIEMLKHEQEAIEKESKDKMEEQEKEKQEQTRVSLLLYCELVVYWIFVYQEQTFYSLFIEYCKEWTPPLYFHSIL